MPYYVLIYDVVENFVVRRQPFREAHLAAVRDAHARGEIVMAGAVGEPPDGAILIFEGATPTGAEEFAARDPYVLNKVVTRWRVVPWAIVVGGR